MDIGPPANKWRRHQAISGAAEAYAAVQDTSRTVQATLQGAQEAAAAGNLEAQAAIQAAGQMHAANVARVVQDAIAAGIQPLTDEGDDLIVLSPQGLTDWITKRMPHLQDAGW
jgi:hypothetical protein